MKNKFIIAGNHKFVVRQPQPIWRRFEKMVEICFRRIPWRNVLKKMNDDNK